MNASCFACYECGGCNSATPCHGCERCECPIRTKRPDYEALRYDMDTLTESDPLPRGAEKVARWYAQVGGEILTLCESSTTNGAASYMFYSAMLCRSPGKGILDEMRAS